MKFPVIEYWKYSCQGCRLGSSKSLFLNLESTQLKRQLLIRKSPASSHITVTISRRHRPSHPSSNHTRANPLQSHIDNLQHIALLTATISSQTPHHTANPRLFSIVLLPKSFSTSSRYSSDVIHSTVYHVIGTMCSCLEFRTFLVSPLSLSITRHHLPPPLSITPWTFHLKLKVHLFKNSYPNSPDGLLSNYSR